MKRILSVLLIVIALLSVCACNGKEEGTKADGGKGNVYTGKINGDSATVTIDGDNATVKITKSYRQSGLEHTYVTTLSAPVVKDGDKIVLDFTKEDARVRTKYTIVGDSEPKAAYVALIKGLSYNKDPLYLDYCDGVEVEITKDSTVWSAAGIGVYEVLTLKLGNGTFEWIY